MAKIIKVYKQSLPKVRFVGKCYTDQDRENGVFANKWSQWWENGWFNQLKIGGEDAFEDAGAPLGLCRIKEGEPFQYWIGLFMPENYAVPEGFRSIDFEASDIAVCLVKGKEPDIYFECCMDKLAENGFTWKVDENGVKWCFERYACPRYTNPDEEGNVILDQCFFL